MKTSVLLDHEPVADGGWFVRALLRIEGDAPLAEDRVPLNLSLVLDRSGSMQGEPLRAAIEAATTLVRRLHMDDIVSVVAYDDEVQVVAMPSTGETDDQLAAEIASIRVGGSTNLSGGWLRGRELVARNLREGGVNRVILLTDGQANRGITDPAQLTGLTRTAAGAGITTTTIGFGPHYDEDLLQAMADGGQGASYYIERTDQASGVFEEELEGLLSLAAQNIQVAVRPGRDAEYANVVHQYPSRSEGDVLTVDVGDLYAREPRRVLFEFLIGAGAEGGAEGETEAQVSELTVTAQVLTAGGGVEQHTIAMPITVSPETGGRVDPTVRKEVLLLEAAVAREQALEAERRGDYRGGSALLRASIVRLEGLAGDDPVLSEELDDLRVMEEVFQTGAVDAHDIKYMKQRMYESYRGRDAAKERIRRTGRE